MNSKNLKPIGLAALLIAGAVTVGLFKSNSSKESTESPGETQTSTRDRSTVSETGTQEPKPTHLDRPLASLDQKIIQKTTTKNTESLPPLEEGSLAHILSYSKSGGSARERVKALLARSLTPEDIEVAYTFLHTEKVPQGMSMQYYHWLVDELITVLRFQVRDGQQLAQNLSQLAKNTERDSIVRDYALQHLGHLHQQEKGDRAEIETVLWSALDQKNDTFAGTALLALKGAHQDGRLTRTNHNLSTRVQEIAANDDYSLASRVTAVGLANNFSSPRAQILARQVVEDKSAPAMLRIASMAVLSKDADNKDLFEKLRYATDKRIRVAAVSNLKKLSNAK